MLAMRARAGRRAAAAGFTLIEMLVVVVLIGVLAALATPSLRAFAANQALSATASDLLAATMTARATAISRNRLTIIEPIDPATGWTSGWRIYIDRDGSGDFDASQDEQILQGSAAPDGIVLSTDTSNCTPKPRFAYRADGFLGPSRSGFPNGGVRFKSVLTARERCVVINKVGRGRICGADVQSCASN